MHTVDTRQYPPTHTQTQDVVKRKIGLSDATVQGCKGDGVDAESLMQESAADTTVTVDEVADNSPLNLPTNPMQGLHPHPAYPTQTPDLPMVSPLQLVYLQPTPHGVNIIPIQAAGQPTITPYNPLGFPSHPHHHPVVVHPGHSFPPHQPFVYHTPRHVYSPGPYPAYPQPMYTSPAYPTFYPGHVPRPDASPHTLVMSSMDTTYTPPYRPQQRFFRPWEDSACADNGGPASCPHKDCGGTGDQHCQSGTGPVSGQGQSRPQVLPFGDEDFPALGSELMKMKI